jgi:hypothetical protein
MCFSVLGKLYHDCLLVRTNEFMLVIIDVDTEYETYFVMMMLFQE